MRHSEIKHPGLRQKGIRRGLLYARCAGREERVRVEPTYSRVPHTDGLTAYVSVNPPETSRDVFARVYGGGLHEVAHVAEGLVEVKKAAKEAKFKHLDYFCLNIVLDVNHEWLFRRRRPELEEAFLQSGKDILVTSTGEESFLWRELMVACGYADFDEGHHDWQKEVRALLRSCKGELTSEELVKKARKLRRLIRSDTDYQWLMAELRRLRAGKRAGDPEEWLEPAAGGLRLGSPVITVPGQAYFNSRGEAQFRRLTSESQVSSESRRMAHRFTAIFEETLRSEARVVRRLQPQGKLDVKRAFYAETNPLTVFKNTKTEVDVKYNVCLLVDTSGSMYPTRIRVAIDVANAMILATEELPKLNVKVFAFDSYLYDIERPEQLEAGKMAGYYSARPFGHGTDTEAALKVAKVWADSCEGPTVTFLITDGEVGGEGIRKAATNLKRSSSLVEMLICSNERATTLTQLPIRLDESNINSMFGKLVGVLRRVIGQ